jgi:hypothetical protein
MERNSIFFAEVIPQDSWNWKAKKSNAKRNAQPNISASKLLPDIAFHLFWWTGHQCILMRLTEHKPVVAMARQDLKKFCMRPHVLTLNNIGAPVL